MTPGSSDQGLVLGGLDGGNPLGFLAAVGTLLILSDRDDGEADVPQLGWRDTLAGWRPVLAGCGERRAVLCDALHRSLSEASDEILDIGKMRAGNKESNKFPFDAHRFAKVLDEWASGEAARRDADFLAGFGAELYSDTKKGEFRCTNFKMVRSGDSKGQGMLHYAKVLREQVDRSALERTLFENWDYRDEGYGLRWDPIENQPYALRWRDPSRSALADGPRTMLAANCLAFEALRCLPCMTIGTKSHTTGFRETDRRKTFVWPIWTPRVNADTMRSLLSLGDLHKTPAERPALEARGIQEVYSAAVIRPNQYYSNFAPAEPVA